MSVQVRRELGWDYFPLVWWSVDVYNRALDGAMFASGDDFDLSKSIGPPNLKSNKCNITMI